MHWLSYATGGQFEQDGAQGYPRTSLRIVKDGFGHEPPAAPEW
jgi:hypothetical protein